MRKILIAAIFILVIATALGTSLYSGRNSLQNSVMQMLAAYGFNNPAIGKVSYQDGYAVYQDISLDPDGFSRISDIQIPAGWFDMVRRKKPDAIVINAIKLSGEYNKTAALDISGWTKVPFPLPAVDSLIVNGGQLDLYTEAGALRFEAKGEITRQPDGNSKLQGTLWATQNQFTAETLWTGELSPNGNWVYDVEIKEANLNLEKFQGSRMSGWLVIDKSKEIVPVLSGEINAGKLTLGDINLMNSHLTLSGPLDLYKLIGSGNVGGYEGMTYVLEVNNRTEGLYIDATIETATLDDLMTFLVKLQQSDTTGGALTSLLLTTGNLDRLRRELRNMSYDVLELQIYGSIYDLAGKIIAKRYKDGVSQNNVISLDPGERNR